MLVAVSASAVTCHRASESPPSAPGTPAGPEQAEQKAPAEALAPAAQRELEAVLNDEFCYCGCPHTLKACLQEHTGCRHAKRALALAQAEAASGRPAVEIILLLSRYHQSFAQARAALPIDERMCQGPADAKVTLVEYSDFECPYCAAARPLLEGFARARDDVRFCFLPFPLNGHPNALPAAQAALYARDQGKFWPMHDSLFENQLSLSVPMIRSLAGKLGLDADAAGRAIAQGKYTEELMRLKEAGKGAGVDATPTVYVNGRKLLLGLSLEALHHTVDDELEWLSHQNAWAAD